MKRALFVSLAVLSVAASHGLVAYTTYGPGQTFNDGIGWTIGEASNQRVAFQFESQESGVLESVTFTTFSIVDGDLNVLLYEDDNDTVGNQIVGWGVSVSGSNATTTTLPNLFPSIELVSGQKYWLELVSVSQGGWSAWNYNDQGITSRARFMSDNITGELYGDYDASAFEVEVVPEPATLALLALAPLALRRKRK